MNLIDLPIEVLEEFVHNLEKPVDVLFFGLTCKLMHSLAIPCPLLYRDVVWPNHDGRMAGRIWKSEPSEDVAHPNPAGELSVVCADYLIEEPRRAKGVRKLVVSKEGAPSAPKFLIDYLRRSNWAPSNSVPLKSHGFQEWLEQYIAILESTQADLARAIWHMSYLQSFSWDWGDPDANGPLWEGLSHTTSIEHAHFTMDDLSIPRGQSRFGTAPDAVLRRIASTAEHWPLLSSLSIEVVFSYFGADEGDDEDRMNSCSWSASPFLRCHYYQLRELELARVRGSAEDVANFFRFHPLIEKVVLILHLFDFSAVDHDALPRLSFLELYPKRDFKAESNGGIGELFFNPLRSGGFRPLFELVVHLDEIQNQDEVHRLLPGIATTLKHLRVETSFESLSNLTGVVEDPVRWILSTLPNLTHLTVPEPREDLQESVQGDVPFFTESQGPRIEVWAGYFLSSSHLEALTLTIGVGYIWLGMEDIEDIKSRPTVELEDIFRRIAPSLRVIALTCFPHEKVEIICTR